MLKNDILNKLIINPHTRKCFIFDLDGTIIFKNSMLSPENEKILKKIIADGHEIIFATGRSYRDFKSVMPEIFHNHKSTLFSGSLSRDIDGQICRSLSLIRKYVEDITSLCFMHNNPFIMDNITHYYHPPFEGATFGFIDSQVSDYRIVSLEKMLETDIYKILIFEMQLYELFKEYVAQNNLAIKLHHYDRCFDIVVNGCNKYDGVLPFLIDYDKKDVFVFGNDFNDYEMLCHFPNSILFGGISELQKVAKINLSYDSHLSDNFALLIDTILNCNNKE